MSQTKDPYEELAAVFMSDAPASSGEIDKASVSPETPIAPARLEVIVVGHLPVRAALWLTPFADAFAHVHETVTALIRLDGDDPTMQLLGAGRPEGTRPEQPRNLREAILSATPPVSTWLIRPSSGTSMSDLLAIGADRFVILSSADQMAVANTYCLVKDLHTAAMDRETPMPEIGLAIMGADNNAAQETVERINRTTTVSLGVPVSTILALPRIDAAIQVSRFMTFSGLKSPALHEIAGWIREFGLRNRPPSDERQSETKSAFATASEADRALDEVVTEAPSAPAALKSRPPLRQVDDDAVDELDAFEPQSPASSREQPRESMPLPESIEGTRLARTIKLAPQVSMEVEGKAPTVPCEPDVEGQPVALATHVPGLTPIVPRSPGHERVELAVDEAGCLHLLARVMELREMCVVEHWARAHRELLSMACPELHIAPACRVVQHIFTDKPLKVADLHGSDLHLHLLTPVEVEGGRGWYAAALNAPNA